MKVAACFIGMLVAAIIQTACKMNGIILGAIPVTLLYMAAISSALWLCEAFVQKKNKEQNSNPSASDGGPESPQG